MVFTREQTTDYEQLAQYAEKAPLAREGRELIALAFYGQLEVLEGSEIEGAIILRFPDMAAARDWYYKSCLPRSTTTSSERGDLSCFYDRRYRTSTLIGL